MKLSLSIMSVPSRSHHVDAMLSQLNQQLLHARARGMDVVGTTVFEDTHRKGPWHGWRGAWETHRGHASTHHVVLQDDLRFCADLPATLFHLAKARPSEVISGFLPRKSVETAHQKGLRWVRTRRFLWAQCVLMPVHLGDEALRWIDEREGTPEAADWRRHDDVRMAAFLTAKKLGVYVPVPHPVEHVGDEIGGSVMGHNFLPHRRRARVWLGDHGRGSDIDWTNLEHVSE
jgi:hypothetical protein